MLHRLKSTLLLGLKFGLLAVGLAAAIHGAGWLASALSGSAGGKRDQSPQNAPFEGYFASRVLPSVWNRNIAYGNLKSLGAKQ